MLVGGSEGVIKAGCRHKCDEEHGEKAKKMGNDGAEVRVGARQVEKKCGQVNLVGRYVKGKEIIIDVAGVKEVRGR